MEHTNIAAKPRIGTALSEKRGMEQSLRNSELRYRRLFESAQDGILILDVETGSISDVNPYLIQMLGYSREEFLEKKLWEVGSFRDVQASRDSFLALQKDQFIRYDNLPLKTKSGRLIQVEFVSNVYLVGDEKVIQCNIRDVSDRKRAEAAVQAKDEAQWSLIENLEDLWLLIKQLPVGVVVHTPDTKIVLCNPEASQILGVASELMLGRDACDPEWNFQREDGSPLPADQHPVNRVIATGATMKSFVMRIARGGNGAPTWVLVNAYPQLDQDQALRQVVVTYSDVSDMKGAENVIRRHLEHLTALVEIDRAINFSFDLDLSLTTLLTHLMVQLGIDAADVLLFNPATRTMEYLAGRGFHSKAIEQPREPLGAGEARWGAQDAGIVHLPDLAKGDDKFLGGIDLAGEEFVGYFAVPLVAKGEVIGVLEVFQRTQQVHAAEWLDLLKALASKAAIAIDNATLFENLQRSNTELAQAYDATIEGWSRAMELRDNMTEGHTQRVADLTLKLARLFGIGDDQLVQVRWGALLHDIGKMGIPDGILLKQGELTPTEWAVMKKHTVFAYEMLSPIRYLRLALDIPCYHHERWDGTGYPFGLKGEQIPLVARIFAVADVWDALRSDRHYRGSWPVAKVRQHLQVRSGTHFDPQVIKVCLESGLLSD
ncbi:MAG: hypothetical protein A2075_04555 [Geobacteraceae bacterium GWC2_58_44]|nr:MAG: hypothetical protein A2075_04555 [Geobacteraceae bacterium GWC2_58_44]HBG05525.1 hypothetical protein [Geobacter sp.]